MASKRLQTAKRYIEQFATFDIQILEAILSEDYSHHFAPSSLTPLGPYTKQGKLDHHKRMTTVMTGFPVVAKEYIESDIGNQVVIWATSQAIFRDEVKDKEIPEEDWTYKGEYIFILSMDPTSEKIIRVVEFLDSKATHDKLFNLMKRAGENADREATGSGAGMQNWLGKASVN